MIVLVPVFIICIIVSIILVICKKQMQFWLPGYLLWLVKRKRANPNETIHLLFCIVDHFEPGNGKVPLERERQRVSQWIEKYPIFASKHKDADGKPPQHTWFFPPHYNRQDHLQRLVQLCQEGYGDIELHLHHDHLAPYFETPETLREKILATINSYAKYGIFIPSKIDAIDNNSQHPASSIQYGFIHGDWALDNSRRGKWCGINNELTILKETGCYADFTFPSINESQPKKVNSIYYAKDNPDKPKSYNTGIDVKVGTNLAKDLMIIEGPLGLRWKRRWRLPYPAIEYGDLTGTNPPTEKRIDFWIKTGIHVKGRPNWVIIKLHTHGAPEENHEALLGSAAEKMYSYLETNYNDGKNYKLHYCTARELYNIIKAGEAGEKGDPGKYRNYLIPSYKY